MANLATHQYAAFMLIIFLCFCVQSTTPFSFATQAPELSVLHQKVDATRTSTDHYSLDRPDASPSCNPETPEIQLDFHQNFSSTDFVASMFLVVKRDGMVHAVNYQEMENEIFGVYEGKLSAEETASLFTQACSRQVRKALIEDRAYPTAPGDFDFYELGVRIEGAIRYRQFQTSNRLPKTVSTLVTGLLTLRKRLTRVEPPFWYLRSGNVTASRRTGLEKRFNVRLATLNDYPENVRSFVETALKCPGHFIPLNQEEHSAMLEGFNRYITQGGESFDLTFFDGWRPAKPLPEPQRTPAKPGK